MQISKMATARLYCAFVLLLYLQGTHGQQGLNNNQNIGVNNAVRLQQQAQRTSNNLNQIPNNGMNCGNLMQQPNIQLANLQQSPNVNLSGSKQGECQQPLSLPPNMQSQSAPQNNFQITKIGFTPTSQGVSGNACASTAQLQNMGVKATVQVIPQNYNNPISNIPVAQISNAPIPPLNLAELAAQPSLLSLINPQNSGQPTSQQIIFQNTIPAQSQLTEAQKQYLVRAIQSQNTVQNQQGINYVPSQPITVQAVATPQQPQAIVTSAGNQPAYITFQAQPVTGYLQNPSSQIAVPAGEEPSIMSMIMSELGPQFAINSDFVQPKKGSKSNLKSILPLIINMLKDRNGCGCRNCGCPNDSCQNNGCPNMKLPTETQFAQIFEGYSNQKLYGSGSEVSQPARIKKNDNEESRNNDKKLMNNKKNQEKASVDSEEISEEDVSEYVDDDYE